MSEKWLAESARDVLGEVGQIEARHRAEQEQSSRLCDEHGWRWFSEWSMDLLAYRFVAIPLAPYKVFIRLTQGRSVGDEHHTTMITRAQQERLEKWIRDNGVTLTVPPDFHDVSADAYVTGHQTMRERILSIVTRRPTLSTRKETPTDETEDARQARLDRASGDFYSYQQRIHTASYGGARVGPDLQPGDGAGPVAEPGHPGDD